VCKVQRWRCSECLNWSASWNKLAPQKCSGRAPLRWKSGRESNQSSRELLVNSTAVSIPGSSMITHNQMQAVAMTDGNEWQAVAMTVGNKMQAVATTAGNEMQAVARTDGGVYNGSSSNGSSGHALVSSGDLIWCKTCGSYAEMKAHSRGIGGACRGPPSRKGPADYGGMWGQLQKLRDGRHPKTGVALPAPVECDGEAELDRSRYTNLDLRNATNNACFIVPWVAGSRFTPYIPSPTRELRPNTGRSAKDKMGDLLGRVRRKEAEGKKRYRLRGKQKATSDGLLEHEREDEYRAPLPVRRICWETHRRIDTASG